MPQHTLNRLKLREFLPHHFSGVIHAFKSLESTNETARLLAKAGAGHGTLVAADGQTKGKGRYGRQFHSPAGTGAYFTLILDRDKLFLEDLSLLTIFSGVMVCRALRRLTGKNLEIKWINDIFLGGKKIGGILAEAVDKCYLLGIGLNIHCPLTPFPAEIGDLVEFLSPMEETPVARESIIGEIVTSLLEECPSRDALLEEYKSYSNVLGKQVTVNDGNSTYGAKVLDIDAMGRLVAQTDNGTVHNLSAGEVRIKL
ncbi:MAG: biotin--[acetyl-CoA-carboxylase] ligase [Turicibacter sp.]|nr:biotin--[acetyl-CoA-carboxylase] ligase [Turicibacter sp.]